MAKFFSIGGMSPSGGEGGMGSKTTTRPGEPNREQLQKRFGEYYKHADEPMTSEFAAVGDDFKFRGDDAIVRHVEKHSDGTQDLIVQRSATRGDSGTYKVHVSPDVNRTQTITDVRRTFD